MEKEKYTSEMQQQPIVCEKQGACRMCCRRWGPQLFIGWVCYIALAYIGVGIAKIVMGAIYINDCKLEPLIPIYLVVSGVTAFLFLGVIPRVLEKWRGLKKCSRGETLECEFTTAGKVGCGFSMFIFIFYYPWVICGCVWVFTNKEDVNSGKGDCSKVLMNFAYAVIIFDLSQLGTVIPFLFQMFKRK